MNYPRVSIIILNWNGWRDTVECLESLYRITYPNYDVIVVDNGSKDESIQKIKEYARGKIKVNSKFFKYNPKNKPIKVFEIGEDEAKRGRFKRPLYEKLDVDRRIILIKNRDNYGFAGGNNVGIKFALSVLNPDYVLLLNNDTVVVDDFLFRLLACVREHIGAISPTIYEYHTPSRIQYSGETFNRLVGLPRKIKKASPVKKCKCSETELISGACVLIPSLVIMSHNLLWPEDYLAYWEDIDYSLTLLEFGYSNYVAVESHIYHKGSATLGSVTSGNATIARISIAVTSKLTFNILRKKNWVFNPCLSLIFYVLISGGGVLIHRPAFIFKWGKGMFEGIVTFIKMVKH